MATLKEIAELSDVSITTVSRILNNDTTDLYPVKYSI